MINPLTVLDMCTTTGREYGSSLAIFSKIDSVLERFNIPCNHCVGFGVDNTSVNLGLRHSIMTHVKKKNAACYFMGCLCHVVHSIACHASEALQMTSGFDVEDLCIMSFIGLTRAKNIKAFLGNFVISVTVTHEIVRYVSVRWLNLERAVYRVLKLYRSLQSYFRSESTPSKIH